MSFLKQSSCSAAIAFSPGEAFLVTGTYVGTTDMNFNDYSVLEVRSTDFSRHGKELHVVGGPVSSSAQFQRLAWSKPLSSLESKRGLIAGSLSDGGLALWDASKVIDAGSQARVSSLATLGKPAGGSVKGLAFNTLTSPHKLATGSPDGEVSIWDLTRPRAPTSSSAAAHGGVNGRSVGSEVNSVAWNNKVDHILASASAGTVTVWDLNQQRTRSKLRDANRSKDTSISAIAWNPFVATQIAVAYEEDRNPVVQVWDLRRSAAPVYELQSHTQGILGLSWSPHDQRMLLSTSKDCQTILWEVQNHSGRKLGEFTSSSYNLDVVWSPNNPGVFATTSCAGGDGQDGSVSLHSLASLRPEPVALQDGSFDETAPLGIVPNWLGRPGGCSFGFGGKLMSVRNEKQKVEGGTIVVPHVNSKQVVAEDEAIQLSPEFEEAIGAYTWESLQQFCVNQIQRTNGEESETWKFLLLATEEDRQRKILEYLGFAGLIPEPEPPQEVANVEDAAQSLESLHVAETNHVSPAPRLPVALPEPDGDDIDFFDEDQPPSATASPRPTPVPISLPKPPAPKAEPKVPKEKAGPQEDKLQRALYVGNYSLAIDICLEANRMADALVIGHLGGGLHFSRAQSEYMKRQPFPYMHIVRAVNERDLLGFLKSQPPTAWRETLAAIFAYADSEEILDLCDALARHLYQNQYVHAAILAWICAGNVDQTVRAWTQTLKSQQSGPSSLQALVERSITFFTCTGTQEPSPALSELLSQYAGLLASQGHMEDALRYLGLVQTDPTGPAAVLKYRIYNCGAPGVPELDPPPAYPFDDSLEQTVQAESTAPAQQPYNYNSQQQSYNNQPQAYNAQHQPAHGRGEPEGAHGNYFSQNAYTTSGRYGSAKQQFAPPSSGPPLQSNQSGGAHSNQPSSATSHTAGQSRPFQPGNAGNFHIPQPASIKPQPPPSQQSAPYQTQPSNNYNNSSSSYSNPSFNASTAYQAPTQQHGFQQPVSRQTSGVSTSGWQPTPPTSTPQNSSTASFSDWNQPSQTQPRSNYSYSNPAQHGHSEQQQGLYNPAAAQGFTASAPKPATVVQPSVFVPTRTSAPIPAPTQASPTFAAPSTHHAVQNSFQPPSQPPPAAPAPEPAQPPPKPGPPANINVANADISKVSGDGKVVVTTLSNVYAACSAASLQIPSKKREMDDTSKRLGQLFWRLNSGEVSPPALALLKDLSQALQSRDYQTASQKQVALTSQHWDECQAFLTGLKRLIKAAQTLS